MLVSPKLLDWCYKKVNILFWTITWKPIATQKIDALMQECNYFKFDEEFGFFYYNHCIVSKHRDKPNQPILKKDL